MEILFCHFRYSAEEEEKRREREAKNKIWLRKKAQIEEARQG